jgi:hypothetical protein
VIRRSVIGLLLGVATVQAGCSLSADSGEPTPCAELYSDARCLAMIDKAATDLHLTRADIVAIDVIPEPVLLDSNGNRILRTVSGGPRIDVRVTLTTGATSVVSMGCIGVAMQPVCVDEPQLRAPDIIGSGYHDVPCAGEPPDGCATPVPTAAPEAAAAAVALRIDRLDIPIDHVGDYDVRLGEARLPNGLLTEGSFAFVDDWPSDVTILEGRARLVVRSLEPNGRPFVNVYEHGWREGTEQVAAFLVFHVDRFDPGARLAIRDVVVR